MTGVYIGSGPDVDDKTIFNYKKNIQYSKDDHILVTGEQGSKGKAILQDIIDPKYYNGTPTTFDDARSFIGTLDDNDVHNFPYVMGLDIDESKKEYTLSELTRDFTNSFSPISVGNEEPVYFGMDNYVGYSRWNGKPNYFGNHAALIAQNIAKEKFPDTELIIKTAYLQRSNKEYTESVLPLVMDQIYPIFIIIVFTLPYMYLLQRAVEEKANKTRESMRMMGMLDSSYWASWFVLYTLQVLMTSVILTIGSIFTVFPGCNPIIIFVFYFFYGMSLFGMILIFIALFATVKTASVGGLIIKLGTYYLRYAFTGNVSTIVRLISSLIPTLNLYNANNALFTIQAFRKVTFENMNFESRNYTLNYFILMCIVDFFFWLLLGLYITYIIPTEFGTTRHPCFCLIPKRRRHVRGGPIERESLINDSSDDLGGIAGKEAEGQYERVGNDLKDLEANGECLKIKNLCKTYPNGFKAVDNLNLTMYSGQIFALLGHNGAGKTTTISVLTGLFGATSGEASGFGIDLLNNQDEARTMMGVCPQHNVLFPTLTPAEHFDIFCDFKGVPRENREQSIMKCLESVDLNSQRDMQSKNLSGGQQRKVSVGIAMLGDSKIVLLDEPTSGMDPTARRRLWDLLKNNKEGKIIILTTHYMEEADILGDRIAIMVHGDAQCCGSSLFLKRKFGVGYNITIDKTTQHHAPQIDSFITSKIPGAIKLSEVSSEISYQLPNAAIGRFKDFFTEMDEKKAELEIKSYGIGVTTLEEVFIKVGDGINKAERYENTSINANPDQKKNDDYCLVDESVKGWSLTFLQLYAMFIMRFKTTMRECRVLFLEIFYPTVLIVLSSVILALSTGDYNTMYALSLNKIPNPQTVFFSYNGKINNGESVAKNLFDTYFNDDDKFATSYTGAPYPGDRDLYNEIVNLDGQFFEKSKDLVDKSYISLYLRDKIITTNPKTVTYDIMVFLDPTQPEISGYAVQGTITAVLRDFLVDPDISFKIKRGSFPKTKLDGSIIRIVLTMLTVFSFSIALGIITSSIAGNICKERADSLKHQQIVSGGSMLSYWFSNYVIDLIKFSIPGLAFIIIVMAFNLQIAYYWLFDILCILSILPFTYILTFVFQKENVARNVSRYIHMFVGGILAPANLGFLVAGGGYRTTGKIILWAFKWNPSFCFSMGMIQVVLGGLIDGGDITEDDPYKHMKLSEAGGDICFLIIDLFAYFILIMLIENKFFVNRRGVVVRHGNYEEVKDDMELYGANGRDILDFDVQEEENRVANTSPDKLEVRAFMLNKFYKDRKITKHAVRDTSFGINFGECFALLGINGAGKTTTFKALTGDVTPSSGEVHIGGFDVQNRIEYTSVRKLIGYCPQFDALFTNLTVKEHLEFYAKIKGVIPEMRDIVVKRQLVEMGLEEYKNAHANRLSGGNKRKLSVAMAMIGNPPIVFLDEPSTGMDPKAKRFMWDIIARISTLRKKSAVILTTHSMEEAEALSTKLGIMVDGQFKCFGSAQHIKSKFGDGYEIEIKIKIPSDEEIHQMMRERNINENTIVNQSNLQNILGLFGSNQLFNEIRVGGLGDNVRKEIEKGGIKIKNFVEFINVERPGLALLRQLAQDFDYIVLIEHYGNSYRIKLPTFNESVGVLFGLFEDRYKEMYHIEEYSVNQTSLEQIFNNFAKQQYTMAQNARTFRKDQE